MIKLIIKYENGDPDFPVAFNNQEDCDRWLDEEMSRPYWLKSNVVEIIDKTPSKIDLDAVEAQRADAEIKIKNLFSAREALSKFDASAIKDDVIRDAISKIMSALGI